MAAASALWALAAASARGRRPPKAGGGPTKYHRLAIKNSLHRVGISLLGEMIAVREVYRCVLGE